MPVESPSPDTHALSQLEATYNHELSTDRWAAAETAYALAWRYRSIDVEKAQAWAEAVLRLLAEFPTDTIEQVAPQRVQVGGVALPNLLHEGVVNERFADVFPAW